MSEKKRLKVIRAALKMMGGPYAEIVLKELRKVKRLAFITGEHPRHTKLNFHAGQSN